MVTFFNVFLPMKKMKTSNGLSLFIVYCGWKLKTMFGNKQQHAENMDVKSKENCVLSSYSVPTVLYTEVLKRNIQYFSRMGI